MKKTLYTIILSVILTILINTTSAQAINLVANGSFENPQIDGTFSGNITSGIQDWNITGGNVNLYNGYLTGSGSNQIIDLNGDTAGTISQTLQTTFGQKYTLTFDISGNFDNAETYETYIPSNDTLTKSLTVSAGDITEDFLFTKFRGWRTNNMGWATKSWIFTANQPLTTLSFISNTTGSGGAVIDNISVTALPVPEPSSIVLGLMSLSGIFGFKKRKINF